MDRRKILSYTGAIILAMSFAMLLSCIGMNMGFGNDKVFQSTVAGSSYYKTMSSELESKLEVLMAEYELPIDLADNLWTETTLYRDVNLYTKKVIEGTVTVDETPECVIDLQTELDRRLSEWQTTNQGYESSEWEQVKEEILAIMEQDYTTGLQLPILHTYGEFRNTVGRFDVWIFSIASVLILILCVALCFMYRHKYRSVKFIMYGVLSGSAVSFVINLMIGRNLHVDEMYITDSGYAELCNQVVSAGFEQANAGAMIGMLLGMILLGVYVVLRERNL